jgi:hypothetical protein
MTAAASPTVLNPTTTTRAERGRVGLVVLASIATGLVLGLLLVLGVFAGGDEASVHLSD